MIPTVINWQAICQEIRQANGWNIKQMAQQLGLKYCTAHAIATGLSMEPRWHTGTVLLNAWWAIKQDKK